MKKIAVLIAVLVMVGLHQVNAHALWIETNSTGKLGEAQKVKLFYGEYASNEREPLSKWYSDVKECSLWLIGPDQKKIALSTSPDSNFLAASFTPAQEGTYLLVVNHQPQISSGTTLYGFLANAIVAVGKKAAALSPFFATPELSVFAGSRHSENLLVNKSIQLLAKAGNATAVPKSISVFSPAGWSREIMTDAAGEAAFVPLWPGRYVLEVTDFKKDKGEHKGKSYEAVWQGATYSFEVVE